MQKKSIQTKKKKKSTHEKKRKKKGMPRIKLTSLAPSFSLSGLRASLDKSINLTARALTKSFKKIDEIQSSLKNAALSRGGALWKASATQFNAAVAKAAANGKQATPEEVLKVNLLETVNKIEVNAKRTEAEIADAEAAAVPGKDPNDATVPGKDPNDAAVPEKQGKKGKDADDAKKRLKYLKIVGILSAVAVAATTTGLVMKSYADKAKEERAQCLARWETRYMDIIKDENGELLEIDSAEKWSQNLLYLEKAIESHDSVNGDPEKANELLVEMYNELVNCISNDTSLVGAFLNGISRDVGNALGNVIDPVAAPLDKLIDSTSDLFKNIGIGLAIFAATVLIVLGVRLVMKRSRRMNEYRIGHNYRRSSGGSSGGSGGRVRSRRWGEPNYQYRRIDS